MPKQARPSDGASARLDPLTLRQVFGRFATGVTVVTYSQAGRPGGMTANSFTSVSLDPPLVLVCIHRNGRAYSAIEANGAFAVHLLHDDQRELSTRFAKADPDRFSGLRWTAGHRGVPILPDYGVLFECATVSEQDGGDHVIFVGHQEPMRHAYFAADFLVHPTFYDPCSLVVLEALACGLPVITTRANGAHELLSPPREGYVLDDPHDHDLFAWSMAQLLDPQRRHACALAARKTAASWTFEHHYQALMDVFAEACRRKQAA